MGAQVRVPVRPICCNGHAKRATLTTPNKKKCKHEPGMRGTGAGALSKRVAGQDLYLAMAARAVSSRSAQLFP